MKSKIFKYILHHSIEKHIYNKINTLNMNKLLCYYYIYVKLSNDYIGTVNTYMMNRYIRICYYMNFKSIIINIKRKYIIIDILYNYQKLSDCTNIKIKYGNKYYLDDIFNNLK